MLRSGNTTRFIFFGMLTVLFTCCGAPKQNQQIFLTKAGDLGDIIVKQAAGDMNICNMYNTVWEYAKVSDMDFRSAAREMMVDTSSIKMQSDSNMQMMDRLMNMVKKPPKGMAAITDKLVALREAYLEFNRFVFKTPETSQDKFNADVDAHIEEINALKNELDELISQAEADL